MVTLRNLLVVILFGFLQMSAIVAGEKEDGDEPPYVTDKIPSMRTFFSYRGGKGLSYSGYGSAEFYYTPISSSFHRIQPFVDVRYHGLNGGKGALNAGLGGRYLHEPLDTVIGFNVYYDYRNSSQAFQQVGIGIEWLASLFDIRVNGYLPVGTQKFVGSSHVLTYPDDLFEIRRRNQDALAGFDAECSTSVGKWVENDAFDIFAAIGGYFYKNRGRRHGDDVVGGRFRFGAEINEFITLEVSTTYDPVFKCGVQGKIMVIFPFGFYSEEKINRTVTFMKDTAREPPVRNEIIVNNPEYNTRKSNF